jgi:hypothetical protein
MKRISAIAFCTVFLVASGARGGTLVVSYTDLTGVAPQTIDLTAVGTQDWIKFGNGEDNSTSFLNTTKIGNPVFLPATLTASGDPNVSLIAFTPTNPVMNFTWSNGNFLMNPPAGPVDTVVTETLTPPATSYPIGLGASFQALAFAQTTSLNVYVQGFDANMVLTASLSDGTTSTPIVVTPTLNPPGDPNNFYAVGDFHIDYAGAGQTLTISVSTQGTPIGGPNSDSAFPNAGFYAAAASPVPAPSTLAMSSILLGVLIPAWAFRRVRQRGAAA